VLSLIRQSAPHHITLDAIFAIEGYGLFRWSKKEYNKTTSMAAKTIKESFSY
jgi:predicted butyrate kinase (DUF1464 family)